MRWREKILWVFDIAALSWMERKDFVQKQRQEKIFFTSHQQVMPSHLLGGRPPVWAVVLRKMNVFIITVFFSFPGFYYWAWHHTLWGDALWSGWISCPVCVPPRPPAHHRLLSLGGSWKDISDVLMLCHAALQQPKYWWSIRAVLASSAGHSTIWAAIGKGNSIPARLSTAVPNVILFNPLLERNSSKTVWFL